MRIFEIFGFLSFDQFYSVNLISVLKKLLTLQQEEELEDRLSALKIKTFADILQCKSIGKGNLFAKYIS